MNAEYWWNKSGKLKSLDEIAIEKGTDKATLKANFPNGLGHGYTPHYEMFFEPIRANRLKMLEIGVGGGESIMTWLDYFPNAHLYGVDKVHDTNPWNTPGQNGRHTFVQGDQSCRTFWACFIADHGVGWDIIMDDGSHISSDIITTYECLWPHLNPGGLYCIEDLKVAPDADQWLRSQLGPLHQMPTDLYSAYFAQELCILTKR